MSTLYLVYARGPFTDLADVDGAVELDEGLYVIRNSQTRSQLYHAVKRRLSPDTLLVAPLSDLPKFKGMKDGSTRRLGLLDSD